ncbi:MAG: HAMP domain-containing histidine kinase [Clostridiales bacterium]|nr:HAMP domain-containing histidine kinase [Clostridiales bacterium]
MEENNKLVLAENIKTEEKAASPEPHSKKKLPLTHSLPAKVAAFILTIIFAVVALGTIFLGVMLLTSNRHVYTVPKDELKREMYETEACNNALNVIYDLTDPNVDGGRSSASARVEMKNISSMSIEFSDDQSSKNWSYDSGKEPGDIKFTFMFYDFGDGYRERSEAVVLGAKSSAKATVVLAKNFKMSDRYSMDSMLLDILYSLRYMTFVIAVITFIMAISGFIFLMSASGRHQTSDKPEASFGTKIPFDILVAGTVLLFGLLPSLIVHNIERDSAEIIIIGFFMIALMAAGLGLCMSFATRVKLGSWWKNTVIYMIINGIWKGIKGLCKLFFKIPLVWRTSLIAAALFLLDLIFVGFADEPEKVMYIFFRSVFLFPALIYLALMLRKLLNGSKAMAEGDLEKQVSTKGMFGDFRKAANNLNSISKGMSLAVEERTKSDRMKTELITNVSHDIKTPLTSIINYSDLISKEPAGSEKIGEYAEVLHRQSEKLKRLIDDLVETSKATTGNLEVVLAPCSVNEILNQAAGEYEQRMEAAGLKLVSNVPEKSVSIMADGRRLWRVFDNLMGNACKYALSGTRVYMSLEEQGQEAVITFKNTSREALNISAEELMERFVRGDKSRNSGTEGNGLGLAIAKSLTELQNGKLELSIDGDLFKAELRFPLI